MIEKLLAFYSALGRPLTLMETARLGDQPPQATLKELERLTAQGKVNKEDGFFSLVGAGLSATERKRQDLLSDLKWKKLLRLAKWFRFAPFIEFVIASGSMAIGNVRASSDFDVLVGVRSGRIFTARYFLNFIFGLLGKRRLDDATDSSPDRFCFNHLITEVTFARGAPDTYDQLLYRNMVPLWGDSGAIRAFFRANTWCGVTELAAQNLRSLPDGRNIIGRLWELFLGGRFGDLVEYKLIAPIAKRRLAVYVSGKPQEGRVVVSDAELEFHFNLRYEKRFTGPEL